MSACEKGSQWIHALDILVSIRRLRFDVVSYAAAMSACEKGNAWRQALDLLDDMKKQRHGHYH